MSVQPLEVSVAIVDRIGGWTTAGIGHSYGAGYDLPVLHEWMKKIVDTDYY
jgi:hypothetical protein